MGQHRTKAPKAAVTREPITPLIVQRLVAAVADTHSTRLKILAGRHSKQDVVSAIEPASGLSLLQIAVVMNNTAAVHFLLSLGSSKDVLWDPLDGVHNSWDLSYLPERVSTDFRNFCISFTGPNVAQDAFEHSGLSLLHIAALVGHKEMVRFLVEQAGIPVDVRAAVTGATPLMIAITRRCVMASSLPAHPIAEEVRAAVNGAVHRTPGLTTVTLTRRRRPDSGLEGPPRHVCGIPASHEGTSDATCKPMLPVAQLLIQLGADLRVVDNSGACLLATAAEAGSYGMLHELRMHLPKVIDCCPNHAGHVLYGMVSNWVRTGTVDERVEMIQYLQSRDTEKVRSGQFMKEISGPITRRRSAVVDGVLKVLPGNELMVTHGLFRLMTGRKASRYLAMKYMMIQGVPITALRLGQQHYTAAGRCDVEMLLMIISTLTDGQMALGYMFMEEHHDLMLGLLADACLHAFQPIPELLAARPSNLHKCAACFTVSEKFCERSLWPVRFSPELSERFDFCALGKPVSPLVLAAAGGVPGAVSSITRTWPANQTVPLSTFLNQPDPCGRLPLIEAIVRSRGEEVQELLASGADLCVADGLGRMALHEVARLGTPAKDLGLMCLAHLELKDAETISTILSSVATGLPFKGLHRARLAQMVVHRDAWYMLPQLVQLGLDVHWTPDGERHCKLLFEAVHLNSGNADSVSLAAFLTGSSLSAALRARLSDLRTTPLGFAITFGHWKWVKPMLDACRREGVNPDELLGWHDHPTPDQRYVPLLFKAINKGAALEHLVEAGYDLGPFFGCCMDGPVPVIRGKPGKDGSSYTVVWERFSMLMMAAACGQSVAVKSLLRIGMDPNFQPTPKNTWVPTAIRATMKWPFVASLKSPQISLDEKLECILELLRWKAAITRDELRQILRMIYEPHPSKVARELWVFLQRKAAACAACGLIGDWRTCARCKAAFYCSRACQHSHWPQHRDTCQLCVGDKVAQAGSTAALHAAPEA